MRVFNLTDVPTEELKQYGLINLNILVGEDLVRPGESVAVPDLPNLRHKIKFLVEVGALAIEKVPVEYAVAKSDPTRKLASQTPPAVPLRLEVKTNVPLPSTAPVILRKDQGGGEAEEEDEE